MDKEKKINRRDFMKKAGIIGAGLYFTGCVKQPAEILPTPFSSAVTPTAMPTDFEETAPSVEQKSAYDDTYLAVARGEDIPEMVRRSLAAIGGIERFVLPGADVIIKPNICTDNYTYEYGATTNPVVVGTLVSLALGAGASRVRTMDNPFAGTAISAYRRSGIEDAVNAAGGEMEVMNKNKFKESEIPDGLDIREWIFYQDILNADVVINVPIAKHHGTTGLTLGCKNMLGTILNRGQIHANIHQRIADLASRVRPALTVVDAVRTLMRGGPTGGNLDDVKLANTIIASADIVTADAYAATLFGLTGEEIGYIQAAANMGLGTMDIDSVKVEEITV